MSLNEKFEKTVQLYPTNPALFFEDREVSYQELEKKVKKLANALISLGLKKGERIALLLPNSIEYVISYLAITRCGGIVTPINIQFQPDEVEYILEDSGASIIIGASEILRPLRDVFSSAKALQTIIEVGENRENRDRYHFSRKMVSVPIFPIWELITRSDEAVPGIEINDDDVAAFLYTSGTTGKPKAAMLTHGNLLSNINSVVQALKCTPEDRFLCVLPMFHAFAVTVCMLSPLFGGGACVIVDKFNPAIVLETIAKRRVTIFSGVPSMYTVLANSPLPDLDFSSWRLCISGGAPLPVEVLKKFEEHFPVLIYEGDGPTECSPVTSFNPLDGERKLGSIGLPIPDVQMKIVDENDNELPPEEIGEIVVKGPNVMKGYWKRPEETKAAMRGGWFHTGDIGKVDEDGYFYILDRKKDMIIVGGLNVYSREVEEVLFQHPGIKEAAVVGISDHLRGEAPKAFLVLKEDAGVNAREIVDFCRKRLARYKIPRKIEFRDSLPKTTTGKVNKLSLKE